MKMYVNMEKLNHYEKKHNRISFYTLIKAISYEMILCNNIAEVDQEIFCNEVIGTLYDEETDEYNDVYQYYIVNLACPIDILQKLNSDSLHILYSEKLDVYILAVTHFGTSWDYVLTDIEPTENLDESDI